MRKLTAADLSSAGLPAHKIIRITGHKNIASIADYDSNISMNEHRHISKILCGSRRTTPTFTSPTSTIGLGMSHVSTNMSTNNQDFANVRPHNPQQVNIKKMEQDPDLPQLTKKTLHQHQVLQVAFHLCPVKHSTTVLLIFI